MEGDGAGHAVAALQVRLNNADVPVLHGVTVTGLHGNAFVLEDEVFGPDAANESLIEQSCSSSRRGTRGA